MAQQANLLQGPEPVETAELHFKLHCRLKVFTTNAKYEEGHCCILAVSQYYGLIFVGNLNGFSVITTKSLYPGINPEEFPKRNIVLILRPTHISVDNSQKILAVVCNSKSGSVLIFYNIQSFAFKDVTPFKITPLSKLIQNSTAEVVDLIWQPNAVGSFVICMSDGSVLALPQGTKDETMFVLPSTTQATCFCWSPKGKQIVIGAATGTLSQYKPDLKLVKTLPPPPLYSGNVVVVSVLWISSFQFAVAYNDRANPESFPVITIVNAAKNEPVTVINYDDVTYSSTLFRNHQIYMSHQSAWNLIFVSSANSIETAVLRMRDSSSWEQWLLGDASRAELPLNPDRQETFPLGWAFDYTSGESIPWGEGNLPPMPRLLLVSDEGLLCVFNVVNTVADAPQLCAPPKENLDDSQFTLAVKNTPPVAASDPPTPPQPAKAIFGSPPTFATAKPAFSFQSSPGFGGFVPKPPPQDAPVSLHQQPEQPQLQIPKQQSSPVQVQLQQPSAQQPPLTLTAPSEPATAPFKLNLSQFSFGCGSNNAFGSKPATADTSQPSEPRACSFALQTSASQKDLFSGKNLPQSTPKKQPEVRVQEKTSISTPAAKKPEEADPAAKPEEVVEKGESPAPATPELAAVDDSVYLSALEEEVQHFSSELQQLSAKMGNLDLKVGTEEDKERMKKSIDGLYAFWNELKETTEGQSAEVHDVVVELMEAFAWLEDAKSRNLQRKNPSYIELKKSEELDPLNARHMSEIAHLEYYIMNQLKQLTGHLEKEWMDHQENHRNEIKNKMTEPPLEEVFKTMHYQLKILHKQKIVLEEFKGKIALRKRKNKSQPFNISSADPGHGNNNVNRASELSKLAENLLQLKINREEDSAQTGAWELVKSQLAAISDRSRKLTRDKLTALRDALSERDMVKIRPVKTSLEFSTFLRSLHLNKATPNPTKPRPCARPQHRNPAPTPPQPQPIPDPLPLRPENKPLAINPEPPKSAPVENTPVPLTPQSSRPEGRSPLASLSGIVSSIGKKTDGPAFVFGSSSFQKAEPSKDAIGFGAKSEQKQQKEAKTSQPFSFAVPKPSESIFGKKEPTAVFGGKVTFNLLSSIPLVVTKSEATKGTTTPSVTITPVTTSGGVSLPFSFSAATTTPVATSSSFTFTVATTASSTSLPKVNVLFGGKEKETTSGFGATAASESVFAATPTTTSTSASPFSGSVSIFGGANKTVTITTTTITTSSTSLFSFAKAMTDTPVQPSGFAPVQTSESKSANESVQTPNKGASETEEVDVVAVDEPAKKPEQDKSKDCPKSTTSTLTTLSTPEVPATASSIVSAVSASVVSTTNAFSRSVPAVVTSSTETSSVATTTSVSSSIAAATTTSAFSFPPVSSTVFFGQAPTATTALASTTTTIAPASTITTTTTTTTTAPPSTTTTNFFGTPALNIRLFEQVSSTTPTTTTTTIFGGSAPTSPPTSIFGGSTPVKTAADHPSTPSTTSDNIFAPSTPPTNSFGQTPLSSQGAPFGQNSESIDQTANLFGQLLSDDNKSVFGGSSTTTTTANIFTSPKSIFEPTTTTTAATSPFRSTFGTSLFGQPTTTTSGFGQSQTSTANSFFAQNMYSGFGKGAAATPTQTAFKSPGFSEPVFGQNVFGQTFKRTTTPTFGGSPSSIFGGTPTSTSTNVFQTPTTNATFGSVPPGPFSGGTSTFGESAFGSSPTFQKPLGGFASPPVFGGGPGGSAPAPAFGGSTFGGSPSFGSLPTFGNVSQGGFGQGSGSTTFENLANQNTVGFGNLAQQTRTPGFGGGFGSSFTSKPAFGGDSFSSWRSK